MHGKTKYVNKMDETLHDFISIAVRTGQRRSKRWFQTGSSAELGWTQIGLLQADGIDQDYDYMCCDTSLVGWPANSSNLKPFMGRYIEVSTDDVPVGYAKLKLINNRTGSKQSQPVHKGYSKLRRLVIGERHGPAFNSNIFYLHTFCVEFWKHKLHAKRVDLRHEITITPNLTLDVVHAIQCPYWPVEADEWITRPRLFGFPSPELVDEITRYGFHLVCVQETNDEPEHNVWRYSFSHAEFVLIRSWSERQRAVYSALKTLYKKMDQKSKFIGLCSYFFKTLMLWAYEENPVEFWQDNSLENVVVQMLLVAVDRLRGDVFCPNYFIRKSNILNRPKRDNEFASLYRWSVNVWRMLAFKVYDLPRAGISTCVSNWSVANLDSFRLSVCVTDMSQIKIAAKQSLAADMKYSRALHIILSPLWLCSFLLLQREFHTEVDSAASPAVHDALSIELVDLYRGLTWQRHGVMCNRNSDPSSVTEKEEEYFRMAKQHLHAAVEWHANATEAVILISSDGVERNGLGFYFVKTNADKSTKQRILNATSELVCVEREVLFDTNQKSDGRSGSRLFHVPGVSDIVSGSRIAYIMTNDTLSAVCNNGQDHDDDISWLYNGSPGWSPTVNVSWFVAMTYLANFYYVVEQHYKRATELCIELIDISNKSVMNRISAERTFTIVLSSSWAAHFDETIQQKLHLVFNDSSITELAVCPIHFALYLLVRCNQNEEIRCKYLREFDDHQSHCISDIGLIQAGSKILQSIIEVKAVSSDTDAACVDTSLSRPTSDADAVNDATALQTDVLNSPSLGDVCLGGFVAVCFFMMGLIIAYGVSELVSINDNAMIYVKTVCGVCLSGVWGIVAGATRTIRKPLFAAFPVTLAIPLIVGLIQINGAQRVCQLVLFCTLVCEAGIVVSMIHDAPHAEGAVQGSICVSVMILNMAILSYCYSVPKEIQDLLIFSGAALISFPLLIIGCIRFYHLSKIWSAYVSSDGQASVVSTSVDIAARNAAAAIALSSLGATTAAVSAASIVFTVADIIISHVYESNYSLDHNNANLMNTSTINSRVALNSSSDNAAYYSVVNTGQCSGNVQHSSQLIVTILTVLWRTAPLLILWNIRMDKFARRAATSATRGALLSLLSVMTSLSTTTGVQMIHLCAHFMSLFWFVALLGLYGVRLQLYFPSEASSYPTNIAELSSWICFGVSKSLQSWNVLVMTLVPICGAMDGRGGLLLVPVAYYVFERQRKCLNAPVTCSIDDSTRANDVVGATLMVAAIVD